jgi:hypothetical protein
MSIVRKNSSLKWLTSVIALTDLVLQRYGMHITVYIGTFVPLGLMIIKKFNQLCLRIQSLLLCDFNKYVNVLTEVKPIVIMLDRSEGAYKRR